MKLLNNTRLTDNVLHDVLVKAGHAVGVKTGQVAVQVNPARNRCSGMAYDTGWVRWQSSGRRRARRKIVCHGAFRIALPTTKQWYSWSPLDAAKRFYDVARHEFGHIKDYHAGKDTVSWSHAQNGRRPRWGRRPEEVRAENYLYDSDKKKRSADDAFAYEEIMALAIALDAK